MEYPLEDDLRTPFSGEELWLTLTNYCAENAIKLSYDLRGDHRIRLVIDGRNEDVRSNSWKGVALQALEFHPGDFRQVNFESVLSQILIRDRNEEVNFTQRQEAKWLCSFSSWKLAEYFGQR